MDSWGQIKNQCKKLNNELYDFGTIFTIISIIIIYHFKIFYNW
jgi:hypothetical protein